MSKNDETRAKMATDDDDDDDGDDDDDDDDVDDDDGDDDDDDGDVVRAREAAGPTSLMAVPKILPRAAAGGASRDSAYFCLNNSPESASYGLAELRSRLACFPRHVLAMRRGSGPSLRCCEG